MNQEIEKRLLGYFVWDYQTFFEWYDIKREEFEVEYSKKLYDMIQKYKGNESLIIWELQGESDEFMSYAVECIWIMPKWEIAEEFNQIYNEFKHRQAHKDMLKTAWDIINWIKQGKSDSELMNLVWNFYVYSPDNKTLEQIDSEILSDMNWVKTHKSYLTWYKELDKYLNGFLPWQFNIIAWRPSVWKSLIATNFVMQHVIQWAKTAMFSLEMSKEQLASRLLSIEGKIAGNKLRRGHLEPEEWGRLTEASEAFSNSKLYIDDTAGITVNEMKAKIRRLGGVSLVVIDYLQLISASRKSSNRVQEISDIICIRAFFKTIVCSKCSAIRLLWLTLCMSENLNLEHRTK